MKIPLPKEESNSSGAEATGPPLGREVRGFLTRGCELETWQGGAIHHQGWGLIG